MAKKPQKRKSDAFGDSVRSMFGVGSDSTLAQTKVDFTSAKKAERKKKRKVKPRN